MSIPNPVIEDGYQVFNCETADQFLETLRVSNKLWFANGLMKWVFRGHQCADWQLLPKVFRSGGLESPYSQPEWAEMKDRIQHLFDYLMKVSSDDKPNDLDESFFHIFQQVSAELKALSDFLNLANNLGFELPNDLYGSKYEYPISDNFIKSVILNRLNFDSFAWFQDVAIAQHYGVPTRLLDFTESPYIAAFFAVKDIAVNNIDTCNRITVWAIRAMSMGFEKHLRRLGNDDVTYFPPRLKLHSVPRFKNKFMSAQKGLFIYDRYTSHHYRNNSRWMPLEDIIAKDSIRKITLPVRESRNVLLRLRAEGISHATIMPTLENVVRELKIFGGDDYYSL